LDGGNQSLTGRYKVWDGWKMDIKAMIADQAEELAWQQYGKGYYELPPIIQVEIFNRATEDVNDKLAMAAEAMCNEGS